METAGATALEQVMLELLIFLAWEFKKRISIRHSYIQFEYKMYKMYKMHRLLRVDVIFT